MSVVGPLLPDAAVLDLFAGSGALGLEALSRGASRAVFVENAPSALKVLAANIDALGAGSRARVVRTDALRFAAGLTADAFDLAFADPPYDSGAAGTLARAFAERPFADWLCLEHGRDEPIPRLSGSETRRYGDTCLTFLPRP